MGASPGGAEMSEQADLIDWNSQLKENAERFKNSAFPNCRERHETSLVAHV